MRCAWLTVIIETGRKAAASRIMDIENLSAPRHITMFNEDIHLAETAKIEGWFPAAKRQNAVKAVIKITTDT